MAQLLEASAVTGRGVLDTFKKSLDSQCETNNKITIKIFSTSLSIRRVPVGDGTTDCATHGGQMMDKQQYAIHIQCGGKSFRATYRIEAEMITVFAGKKSITRPVGLSSPEKLAKTILTEMISDGVAVTD